MTIMYRLLGETKTTKFWNRRKEQTLSFVVTLLAFPFIIFYVLGRYCEVLLTHLHMREAEYVERLINEEKIKQRGK